MLRIFSHILVPFQLLLIILGISLAAANDHTYNIGDQVPLFVNKVGPLNNPSETYHYYDLPFCQPDEVFPEKESLGEVLNGDRLTNTLYQLKFGVDKVGVVLCQKQLNQKEVSKFRWSISDEEEDKEVGWKYLHGDVFRCPSNMPLLCAVIGAGTQLLTLFCCLFVLAFLGILYPYNRGTIFTSLVIIYTLTSVVAGYSSASFYSQFVETGWERTVTLSAVIFLGPFLVTEFFLNLLAVSFGATLAIPFGTMLIIILVYALIGIPLLALGGVVGYRCRSEFQAPSATKKCAREIPSLAWYRKTPGQMFLAGLLPFSAIVVELHQLYATLWGYKILTLPGILLFMFIILVIITVTLSIALTYIQLTMEDHEWWWQSIFRGGSAAVFIFAYSVFFYCKSNMSGVLQTTIFFVYNTCMCYAIFLMLGTISLRASLMFVRRIYHAVKSE